MKKIVNIALTILLIAGTIFLLGFARISHERTRCEKVSLDLIIPGEDTLLSLEDINGLINQKYGTLKGKEISEINIKELKNLLFSNPYVDSCKIFLTVNKTLNIKVRQRVPMIQLYNYNNSRYLLGSKGEIMPYPAISGLNLPVASGWITEEFTFTDILPSFNVNQSLPGSCLRGLFEIMRELKEDDYLKIMIDHIYVTDNKEFELIPKVGTQIIQLGDTTNLKSKLKNLKAFYTEVIPKSGWEYYKKVDLRFENQVVCTKNISDGN